MRIFFLPSVTASIRISSARVVGCYTALRFAQDFAIEAARISTTNMATQVILEPGFMIFVEYVLIWLQFMMFTG